MKKSTIKSEHNSRACGRDTDRRYTEINVKHLLHGSNAPQVLFKKQICNFPISEVC